MQQQLFASKTQRLRHGSYTYVEPNQVAKYIYFKKETFPLASPWRIHACLLAIISWFDVALFMVRGLHEATWLAWLRVWFCSRQNLTPAWFAFGLFILDQSFFLLSNVKMSVKIIFEKESNDSFGVCLANLMLHLKKTEGAFFFGSDTYS